MKPKHLPAGPGPESVWDYPRPPRIEPTARRLAVIVAGHTVAETSTAFRVLETSHPPVYYFPPADVDAMALRPVDGSTTCEWKGHARYFDVVVGTLIRRRAAWSYPQPTAETAVIRDYIAFYAGRADLCTVDGQPVTPQPGGFYGGWITPDLVGPFKGAPGTSGW
jgi:uncharacterized protein (DUF427 family)